MSKSLDDPLGPFHPKQTDSNKILWQAVGMQQGEVSILKDQGTSCTARTHRGTEGRYGGRVNCEDGSRTAWCHWNTKGNDPPALFYHHPSSDIHVHVRLRVKCHAPHLPHDFLPSSGSLTLARSDSPGRTLSVMRLALLY